MPQLELVLIMEFASVARCGRISVITNTWRSWPSATVRKERGIGGLSAAHH
jgi:hypothetical protein